MEIRKQALDILSQAYLGRGEPLPVGASEAAIAALEERMGLTLPPEMRDWLATCNGARIGPGGMLAIVGIGDPAGLADLERMHALVYEWVDTNWLLAGSDGSGNYYVIDTTSRIGNTHPVYFIDHDDGYDVAAYIVASGFWQFLRFLLADECVIADPEASYWPFDRDRVIAEDPDILLYDGEVSLPWVANTLSEVAAHYGKPTS